MSAWVHCYTCCHMILAEVAKFFWDLFPSSFQYWPSSTKFAKLAALSAFLCSKGHSRRLTPPPSNQPLHNDRNREILSKNLTVLPIYPTHLILLLCLHSYLCYIGIFCLSFFVQRKKIVGPNFCKYDSILKAKYVF